MFVKNMLLILFSVTSIYATDKVADNTNAVDMKNDKDHKVNISQNDNSSDEILKKIQNIILQHQKEEATRQSTVDDEKGEVVKDSNWKGIKALHDKLIEKINGSYGDLNKFEILTNIKDCLASFQILIQGFKVPYNSLEKLDEPLRDLVKISDGMSVCVNPIIVINHIFNVFISSIIKDLEAYKTNTVLTNEQINDMFSRVSGYVSGIVPSDVHDVMINTVNTIQAKVLEMDRTKLIPSAIIFSVLKTFTSLIDQSIENFIEQSKELVRNQANFITLNQNILSDLMEEEKSDKFSDDRKKTTSGVIKILKDNMSMLSKILRGYNEYTSFLQKATNDIKDAVLDMPTYDLGVSINTSSNNNQKN